MSSNHQSLHIVQSLLQTIIVQPILSKITDKIESKNLSKKLSSFGNQKIRKLLPKIIETATFNLKNQEKTDFLEDQMPQSKMLKFQRQFRKSHNERNKEFNKNHTFYSSSSQDHKQDHECKSDRFLKSNQIETETNNSLNLSFYPKQCGEKISEPKLIKLNIESERQDEFIIRKRHNFQRKLIIQKRLQTISDSNKTERVLSLIKQNVESLTFPNLHFYTTDYNGDLINFKDAKKQRKSALKHQNSHEARQDQAFLKQKNSVKFKIKTFVQKIPLKLTKTINFEQQFKESERDSSDSFSMNQQKNNAVQRLKTMKFLHHPLDCNSIIKNLKLSPGVTLENSILFQGNKQNNVCMETPTFKQIGKLIRKQSSGAFQNWSSGNKKFIKNEFKLKKFYQKHRKFAEIQYVCL